MKQIFSPVYIHLLFDYEEPFEILEGYSESLNQITMNTLNFSTQFELNKTLEPLREAANESS